MPIELPRVAMTTSQQPSKAALPAKQRPATIPTSGTRPLRRAKLAKVVTCRPATTGMSTSPGRPPPPSANRTTGSRCFLAIREQPVGLLVVAHALGAGEHGRVVRHDDGARSLGAERAAVDAADSGHHAVGGRVAQQVVELAPAPLRREREPAVFDEAARVAQVGDVLARGAQAERVPLGDRVGPAGIGEQRFARAQLEQVGAQCVRGARARGAARDATRLRPRVPGLRSQQRDLVSPSATTSPTPQRTDSTTPSPAARTSCSIFIDSTIATRSPSARCWPFSTASAAMLPARGETMRMRAIIARPHRPHRAGVARDRQAVEVDRRRRGPRRGRRSRAPVPAAIVQPSVPWPVARNRLAIGVGPTTGVPSGVIGLQAAPELGAREVAAAREEVADDVRERLAPRLVQLQRVAGELGGAADADAVAEARDRDLVRLVHHGRLGCACADRGSAR